VEPADGDTLMREVRMRHPRFLAAVIADAQITASYRGERAAFRSRLDGLAQAVRLMGASDAFLAQALYRAKARMQALGIPVLPRIAHRLAIVFGQVSIGDPVIVAPGVYLMHGQVVIDGFTEIGPGATIGPFVTVGLRGGDLIGPTVGAGVAIGTGAKVLGRIRVGDHAQIGANATVIADVPAGSTAVGVHAAKAGP
jgi:serine O-acetyltransferase